MVFEELELVKPVRFLVFPLKALALLEVLTGSKSIRLAWMVDG